MLLLCLISHYSVTAFAGSCGQSQEAMDRLMAQAAVFGGRAYAAGSDLCAESAADTARREARLAAQLRAQAAAYARGDSMDAQRLATVPSQQWDTGSEEDAMFTAAE